MQRQPQSTTSAAEGCQEQFSLRALLEKHALFLRTVRLEQEADLRQATSPLVRTNVMLHEIGVHPEPALDVPSAIHQRKVCADHGLQA